MTTPVAAALGLAFLATTHFAVTPGQAQDAGPFTRVYSVETADVTPPVVVRLGQFDYFPTLSSFGAGASVEVEITVGADGRPRDAMILKPGNPQVDALAIRAAASSRFEPGRLNGQPVAVRMLLEFGATSR